MSSEVSTEGPASRSKKPLVMIGGAVAVAVLVVALWFSGILGHLTGHSRAARSAVAAAEQPVLVDLPDMVSNLDTGTHHASFIKLHAKIKVARAADAAAIQSNLPQIMDIFQTYLRSTRPDEVRGGEGTYRLREALMNRIDAEIAPAQVADLFFTQLLVQ